MTTPNSIVAPTPVVPATPAPSAMDSLAASFDVQDPPHQYNLPAPAPAQPAPANVPPQGQPAPSAAVVATAVVPKHPAWLMAQAVELGVHPLLLDRLDTNELGQFVYDQNKAIRENGSQASRSAAVQNQNPAGGSPSEVAAAAVAAAQAAVQTQQAKEFDWGEFQEYDEYGRPVAGKKRKYTDEDVNPALAHHIKALTEKIGGLEKFIGTMQNQAVASHEMKFQNDFDAAFAGYPAVFGTGTAATIKSQPEFFERRKLVFGAAKAMMKSLPPEIASKMPIATAVATMTKSMFGIDAPAAAASQSGQPAPDFTGGAVARPTQRQPSSKPLGTARATEAVTQWWQDQAVNGSTAEGDTSIDEFPE